MSGTDRRKKDGRWRRKTCLYTYGHRSEDPTRRLLGRWHRTYRTNKRGPNIEQDWTGQLRASRWVKATHDNQALSIQLAMVPGLAGPGIVEPVAHRAPDPWLSATERKAPEPVWTRDRGEPQRSDIHPCVPDSWSAGVWASSVIQNLQRAWR